MNSQRLLVAYTVPIIFHYNGFTSLLCLNYQTQVAEAAYFSMQNLKAKSKIKCVYYFCAFLCLFMWIHIDALNFSCTASDITNIIRIRRNKNGLLSDSWLCCKKQDDQIVLSSNRQIYKYLIRFVWANIDFHL